MNVKRFFWLTPARRTWRLASLIQTSTLALLTFLTSIPALAANGRDFAAFYRYDKTADLPDKKQVTVFFRFFNYSGTDVERATVVMEGFPPTGADLGSVAGVAVDDGGHISISGTFVIPAAEYDRWQQGALPHLRIEYFDEAGNKVRRPVELSPGPVPMGEQP